MRKLAILCALIYSMSLFSHNNDDFYYSMTWEELSKHKVPEWFLDAKFGIYAHLGVYCVPAFLGEWYPRNMYQKDSPTQKHHIATYGPLEKFNYHDFIPMFKLKNFNADEWADLYYRSGAKFAGPVAEHHDGFSMWASKVNPWNAKKMGPKRDVVGELAKAIKSRGLKFITSFHHGFNLDGYYATVPGTATADPKYAALYGKLPLNKEYDLWLAKLKEVIDNYDPDQIWFDWGLRAVPLEYRRKFASYYYKKAQERGKECIITRKLSQLPDGVGVKDFEGGSSRDISPFVWQTDQSTGGSMWSWNKGLKVRSLRSVLFELINVTSKNGILLLNVCPKADGTISDDQKQMLYGMGDWLKVNGEAIYATRPWRVSGEGPQMYGDEGYYYNYCSARQNNKINIRYTQKNGILYAICLAWPGKGFTFDKLQVLHHYANSKVTLLGYGDISYQVKGNDLIIDPFKIDESQMSVKNAYVLKIENFDIQADPYSKLETVLLDADNATPSGEIILRKGNAKVKERNRLYHWDNPKDKVYWLIDVKVPGKYYVRGEFATRFRKADMYLSNGENKLEFSTEPRDKYGESVLKDYGTIDFSKAGHYTMELGIRPMDDFPGIQGFWQIEMAPEK